jgi:hypothetical protein
MRTAKYLTTSNLFAWPEGILAGETLTNVRRADQNGLTEKPNEEKGVYAFFDCKGEGHRAFFHDFEQTAKPLEQVC